MSASHATLSLAADDRKARLAKLKNLKRKQPADEIVAPESEHPASPPAEVDVASLHLSGRNYDIETKGPKLGFEAPPTLGMKGPTLEEQAALVEKEAVEKAAEDAKDSQGIDLFKLQPKKPKLGPQERPGQETRNIEPKKTAQPVTNDGEDGGIEAAGMDGVALVEGLRVREREEEEEERKEREDEDLA
ncbi:hypothetical protein NPX13_g6358 [Xylaria arbuscula]|uniref:Uncharacterized protein n=1 Tax=Xylaria arbuscula TaxID=114810 RepID=A0A9W8TM78_9PEZI|nr:hypothetical protein NPX13_g6358 [Xylaria arbuscula]